jgi:hypothetical protein
METSFVVLFILIAVWGVVSKAMTINADIGRMSNIRAQAQGLATEMSLKGNTTHLVRIDEATNTNRFRVNLFVVSEGGCGSAIKDRFNASIGGLMNNFNCTSRLYWDTKYS